MSLNPFRQAGKPMPSAETPNITYGPRFPRVVKEKGPTRLVQTAPRRYTLERWVKAEAKDAMGQRTVTEQWGSGHVIGEVPEEHASYEYLRSMHDVPPGIVLDLIALLTDEP